MGGDAARADRSSRLVGAVAIAAAGDRQAQVIGPSHWPKSLAQVTGQCGVTATVMASIVERHHSDTGGWPIGPGEPTKSIRATRSGPECVAGIFISHSSRDDEPAGRIIAWLKAQSLAEQGLARQGLAEQGFEEIFLEIERQATAGPAGDQALPLPCHRRSPAVIRGC